MWPPKSLIGKPEPELPGRRLLNELLLASRLKAMLPKSAVWNGAGLNNGTAEAAKPELKVKLWSTNPPPW